jgi:hypothetical protein
MDKGNHLSHEEQDTILNLDVGLACGSLAAVGKEGRIEGVAVRPLSISFIDLLDREVMVG